MGYLRNRGTKQHPEWYIRFKDSDGKWKQRHSKQATKDAARDILADAEARVKRQLQGIVDPTPEELARKLLTVGDLAARFLGDVEGVAGYAPPRIKDLASYRNDARSVFKTRVGPSIGSRPAAAVRAAELEAMCAALTKRGLAAASVVQTLAILSKLYNWARKAGLVECVNPVAGIERPRVSQSIDYLDKSETCKLLACAEVLADAPGATHEDRVRWAMVAVAVYCGLRKGELFGLRWRDVDLDACRLTVARSYRLTPKSGEVRHVPIHPDLAPVLRKWKKRAPECEGLCFAVEALPAGWRARTEPGRLRMGAAVDSVGIVPTIVGADCHLPTDGKPWHMLRHTFAAHAVMSGASLYSVQRLLGHATPQMTQRYAHLAPDFMAREVARMSFAPPAMEGVTDFAEERRRRVADGDD